MDNEEREHLEQMLTRMETQIADRLADRLREMETHLLESFRYWEKRIESSSKSA